MVTDQFVILVFLTLSSALPLFLAFLLPYYSHCYGLEKKLLCVMVVISLGRENL